MDLDNTTNTTTTDTNIPTSNIDTQLLQGDAMSPVPGKRAALEHPGAGVGDGVLVAVHHTHPILQVVPHLYVLYNVVVEVYLKRCGREMVLGKVL